MTFLWKTPERKGLKSYFAGIFILYRNILLSNPGVISVLKKGSLRP
jgi:hypothetical protein